MSYNTENYNEQGGEKDVIGGEQEVTGTQTISGEQNITGTMKKDGVEVTATAEELNELDLDEVGAGKKYKVISIEAPSDATEQDTGEDLPEGSIVTGVFLDVTTKEDTATTKTLDVGTDSSGSGTSNGFLDAVAVDSEGIVKGTLDYNDQTLGEHLYEVSDNTNDVKVPEPFVFGTDNITFAAGSSDFDELEADIIVEYIEVA